MDTICSYLDKGLAEIRDKKLRNKPKTPTVQSEDNSESNFSDSLDDYINFKKRSNSLAKKLEPISEDVELENLDEN